MAMYQYKLIWMLLTATIMGLVVQFLACKLGLIAQHDLAQQCRESYPRALNYILWIMAEIAIIASDVPEVLGTAFALNMLFKIPLGWGVVITALDTLAFLLLQYASIRLLEAVIGGFLMIVSGCFIVEMFFVDLDVWGMLEGFIPLFEVDSGEGSVGGYAVAAVGLLGAVVMPHNLFLHSALVKTRKVERSYAGIYESMIYNVIECAMALGVSFVINFCIISISSAVFYYSDDTGLDQAADLLAQTLGNAPWVIFGIAMWKRNLITRSVAIIPSLAVVLLVGQSGADALIVWSQVLLSIQLPFALIPLLKMTYNTNIMGDTFRNSVLLQAVGWAIGVLIIIANITLIGFSFQEYLDLSTVSGQILLGIEIVVGLCYAVFLIYLGFVPVGTKSTPPIFAVPEEALESAVDFDFKVEDDDAVEIDDSLDADYLDGPSMVSIN